MKPDELADKLVPPEKRTVTAPPTAEDWVVWGKEMSDSVQKWKNDAVAAAVQAERERCAKVAESSFSALDKSDTGFVSSVCETIACNIRSGQ